jgi:hypothetical protein
MAKILWNSTLSPLNANYGILDVENFYLVILLDRFEYMQIGAAQVPEAFKQACNLHNKIQKGHIYMEIRRGCYRLPQAGILANKLLKEHLTVDGYSKLLHSTGLLTHKTRPIQYTLVVNDFGVKYVGEDISIILIRHLTQLYCFNWSHWQPLLQYFP